MGASLLHQHRRASDDAPAPRAPAAHAFPVIVGRSAPKQQGAGEAPRMALLITDSRPMAVARLENIDDGSPDWLGTPGAGSGEFDAPGGIAATPAGGFVVADSRNHRIVGFNDIDGSGW